MFFDELDVLQIRLNELDSVVDQFVIIESLETHGSKNSKPAILRENWGVVKQFEKKIKYILLEHLQPPFEGKDSSWPRENFQRLALTASIREVAHSGDTVMLSDCDEIPRASAIPIDSARLQVMAQDLFYYNVNTYGGEWHGTVVGPLEEFFQCGGLQEARNRRDHLPIVANGGWHFSYFGNLVKIRTKVANFAHASDYICTEFMRRSDEEAQADIQVGGDLYRRDGVSFSHRRSDDPSLPMHFLANRERFRHLWT